MSISKTNQAERKTKEHSLSNNNSTMHRNRTQKKKILGDDCIGGKKNKSSKESSKESEPHHWQHHWKRIEYAEKSTRTFRNFQPTCAMAAAAARLLPALVPCGWMDKQERNDKHKLICTRLNKNNHHVSQRKHQHQHL